MFRFLQIALISMLAGLMGFCGNKSAELPGNGNHDDTPVTPPAKKLEIAYYTGTPMPAVIKEPSDLCYGFSGNSLFTVDDNSGKIFELDLKGNLVKTFPYSFGDLEGICIDEKTKNIYISEERSRFIIRLDQNGAPLDTIRGTKSGVPADDENHGFEGITLHGDTLYIVNQENPGMYLKYNRTTEDWIAGNLSVGKQSNGKEGSYSGLYYDTADNTLWLLCSKSQKIIHCDLNFNVLDTVVLPAEIEKPEGITVSGDHTTIWLVTDNKPNSKFYTVILK